LGGHDHFFFHQTGRGNLILKSGTDFRELTLNKVKFIKNNNQGILYQSSSKNLSEVHYFVSLNKGEYRLDIETELMRVTQNMKEDETISNFVSALEEKTEEKFKQIIGYLASPIDARFSFIRNFSMPISNFLGDVIRIYMNTDCLIINSGTLRIDSIINEGELTYDYDIIILVLDC
jgi:2',3'-cyclic-nucleotide 2'-phosphodiesterase (5'-nucleotidase family)